MGEDSSNMAINEENEEDEVDMGDLVARLMAANKAAQGSGAAAAATPAAAPAAAPAAGGTKRSGTSALYSLIRTKASSAPSVDEESKKGQFGWFSVMDFKLPYIVRSGSGYIPTKIVEKSVFGELLKEIPQEAVECAAMEAVNITEAEAKLLNEVNMKHSEGAFGKETFSQRDKMVEKDQFEKFVTFLLFCRKCVLLGESPGDDRRCGVIKVKGDGDSSKLPYTVLAGSKWVPLAYFEGELGNLKTGAKTIRSWDLAYLRVASRLLGSGIAQKLTESSCQVVRLDTILNCYSSKPKTEDVWSSDALMSRAKSSPMSTAGWTVACKSGPRRKYSGKLTLIKEFPTEGSGPAYKAVPTQVEGTKLVGVNVKPRQWHDLMVPLADLVAAIPGLEVEEAGKLLAGKGTNLFRGNQGQAAVMDKEGKSAAWDPVPLIRVGDAKKHLAALKVEGALPPNKRSKME